MNWELVRIDQIAERVTKGTTPTTYGMPFVQNGINFVKAEALNGDSSLGHSGFNFITQETHERLSRSILHENDVLVTIAGANIGRCGIVHKPDLPANANQAVGIIRILPHKADPRFVYYHFKLPATRQHCLNIGRQAAQPNVNLTNLKGFKLSLPHLSVQRKIADILSAYDELIEINQRRMALLERAGREIYREWFVRLRFPGHERTKIVDGVPEGWEQVKVGKLLGRTSSKKKIKKNDYLDSGLFPCVDQSREFIGGYTDDVDAIHETPLPVIVFGDHTRIVKFIDFPFARGADGTQLLTPNRDDMSIVQLYFALDAIDLSDYFYARHFKFLKHQMILVPTKTLGDNFTAFASEIMEQIKGLREQNRKLSRARDMLLPRLMSGRLSL